MSVEMAAVTQRFAYNEKLPLLRLSVLVEVLRTKAATCEVAASNGNRSPGRRSCPATAALSGAFPEIIVDQRFDLGPGILGGSAQCLVVVGNVSRVQNEKSQSGLIDDDIPHRILAHLAQDAADVIRCVGAFPEYGVEFGHGIICVVRGGDNIQGDVLPVLRQPLH